MPAQGNLSATTPSGVLFLMTGQPNGCLAAAINRSSEGVFLHFL
jgi:hypothetical protein